MPIAIAVAILLAIVATSYRQTIFAYPSGGGSYIVSRENLGEIPSLVAGASLLVDYILTVAVSISAGVAAIVSIPQFEGLAKHRVAVVPRASSSSSRSRTCAASRSRAASSRSRRTSTSSSLDALVVLGLTKSFFGWFGGISTIPFDRRTRREAARQAGGTLSLFLILKGFSSGAVALTGVEAISNGVPAFRRPESKNAATTLAADGDRSSARCSSACRSSRTTCTRTRARQSRCSRRWASRCSATTSMFWILQLATAGILTLAANTAYADFPRLSSIIARDGYLPRQLANRGDRLVFSNGVLVLAGAAGVLIVAFGGKTNALIPLYAVGVFLSFTLSQAGMVRHHQKEREPHWKRGVVINGVGAVATAIVTIIVASTKFTSGAWVPLVVIPMIVLLFKTIKRHYRTRRRRAARRPTTTSRAA